MNRSCNSILCRFGIHTADPYVHIQVRCRKGSRELYSRRKAMKTEKKNLRRISIVVTAQTKGNLERLAAVCGYSEIGRVVDKLTREKMISLHDFERKEKYRE